MRAAKVIDEAVFRSGALKGSKRVLLGLGDFKGSKRVLLGSFKGVYKGSKRAPWCLGLGDSVEPLGGSLWVSMRGFFKRIYKGSLKGICKGSMVSRFRV